MKLLTILLISLALATANPIAPALPNSHIVDATFIDNDNDNAALSPRENHGTCRVSVNVTQHCAHWRNEYETYGEVPGIVDVRGEMRWAWQWHYPAQWTISNFDGGHSGQLIIGIPNLLKYPLVIGGLDAEGRLEFLYDQCKWNEEDNKPCAGCLVGAWTAPEVKCPRVGSPTPDRSHIIECGFAC